MLTQNELKSLLHYNIDTGEFTWKVPKAWHTKVGSKAGSLNHYGYIQVMINRKSYLAHRLAFLYMEGELPKAEIDHINRDRSENFERCSY